ncbi:MAG: ABC transporter ATP-binding protein [Actinomycetota bacterium]
MALLEAHNVTVSFGGLVAVNDVSIAVERREVVGLIGPNGAGKTTLLAALSGIIIPRQGRVLIDGVNATAMDPEQRALAGMARTFQRLELFRKLTVADNLLVAAESRFGEVDFMADLLGRTRRGKADRLANRVLKRLGLQEVASRWADEVPLGVGRLVEVGRALCTEPRLLLLDEPSGGLDDAETDRLADVLRDVRRGDGPAMLIVEHDVDLVMELSDRVYVMDFGRLIAEGTPKQVRRDPVVQAAYLGTEVSAAAAARHS